MKKHLKPTGKVFITTPNNAHLKNRVKLLAGRAITSPPMDYYRGYPYRRNNFEYTLQQLRDIIRHSSSLKMLEAGYLMDQDPNLFSVANWITSLYGPFKPYLYCILGP